MSEPTLMSADTSTDDAASQPSADDAAAQAATPDAEQQPADADKTEGEQPKAEGEQEGGDKADNEDEPQGAPEEYADFTVPEGVELDAEVLGEFKSVAKELNLPQEAAQKVTDLGVKLAQKWASETQERVAEMQAGWRDEAQADKEIGGQALAENLSVAKRAVDKFGTPAFRELLEQSGLGNHPEVIRFAARVGKAISEDTFVAGGTASQPATAAKTLFPNMN